MEVEVKMKKITGETEVVKYAPQNKYDKNNTKVITLKLNKKTDADLLEWVEGLENKQGTIKEVLREYLSGDTLSILKKIQESGRGYETIDEIIDSIEYRSGASD